jgi:hypothetical protein
MSLEIKAIRELAKKFSPEEIEGCITQQLETGENVCLRDESSGKVISDLAKTQFIRIMMERGMTLPDPLRELARRMRSLRESFE